MSFEAAPPAIALVRDFVNTVEWQVDADEWATAHDAERWFARHGLAHISALSDLDLVVLRRVREGMRSLLLMNAGHDPLVPSIDRLNDALAYAAPRVSFDDGGTMSFDSAAGSGLSRAVGSLLDAVERGRADGSWVRLKACSRDSCRWAYWDASRNRSGRWCSMEGCGNYVKMRRRNSPEAARDDVIPLAAADGRAPTLVDVAAAAGVSMKTVSNVVTGAVPVREATRVRVQAAIDDLGYEPNLAARALSAQRRS